MTSDSFTRYVGDRASRTDRRRRLRPMSAREITDLSMRVFQNLGFPFVRIMVIPALFCTAGLTFISVFLLPKLFSSSQSDWQGQIVELGTTLVVSLLVGAPLYILGITAATILTTHLVSDFLMGNVPDPASASRTLASKGLAVFAMTLQELLHSLVGVLIALGLLLMSAAIDHFIPKSDIITALVAYSGFIGIAIGGLYFLYVRAKHGLAPTVLLIEGSNVRTAAKRSRMLMKNNDSALVGQFLNLGFVAIVLYFGLGGGLELFGIGETLKELSATTSYGSLLLAAYEILPAYIVICFSVPVWATMQTLTYYDRRIRLEGYDIDVLAGDVWRADQAVRFQL